MVLGLAIPRATVYNIAMFPKAPGEGTGNKSLALILGAWICLAAGAGVAGWLEAANAPVVAGVIWSLTALRLGLDDPRSMHALREFPLSLLPMFLVPLIIVSHVLIFFRAAKLKNKPS